MNHYLCYLSVTVEVFYSIYPLDWIVKTLTPFSMSQRVNAASFPLHHFINIRRIPTTTFMAIKTTFVKFKLGQVNDKYMSKPVELGGLHYRKKQRCKFSELTSST